MLYRHGLIRSTLWLALVLGAGAPRAGAGPGSGPEVGTAPTPALSFASDVAVVNIHATVTRDGEAIADGLKSGDFRVSEDGQPQEVTFFAHQDVPVTYTLLVDVSGSMSKRARLVFEALETFIRTMRPGDRASLVQFGTTAKLIQEETGERETLLAATDRIPGEFEDGTALYEVLFGHFWQAVETQSCRAGSGARRCALVVFSDGKDESSRRSFERDVLDAARRAELAVYPIAMTWHSSFLERLARETGGRVSYVSHGGELPDAYRAIAAEVASQYTVGYVPRLQPVPGAWHPVKVTVTRKGVTVRHRTGYFTPGADRQARALD
jgi:Ca-activated chloride channel family protein